MNDYLFQKSLVDADEGQRYQDKVLRAEMAQKVEPELSASDVAALWIMGLVCAAVTAAWFWFDLK